MLDAKVKKPQFQRWYVKEIFGNKIYPGTSDGADLSKLDAFLLMFPLKQIDLILKLTNHNLAESGKKLLTKSMLFIFLGLLCYSLVVLYSIRYGFGTKWGSGNTLLLLNLKGLGLNIGGLRIFGDI